MDAKHLDDCQLDKLAWAVWGDLSRDEKIELIEFLAKSKELEKIINNALKHI